MKMFCSRNEDPNLMINARTYCCFKLTECNAELIMQSKYIYVKQFSDIKSDEFTFQISTQMCRRFVIDRKSKVFSGTVNDLYTPLCLSVCLSSKYFEKLNIKVW